MLNKDQIRVYLDRIGWFEEHGGLPSQTVEDLDALVWLHQTHVPFENADAHLLHKAASLDEADLFAKIVTNRRGGICYELNAAFHALLLGLGFDVVPVFARNVRNIPAGASMPISHRSELVRLGHELRYVDVGYGGPMAGCSMLVEEGSKTLSAGRWFMIDRAEEEGWWRISFASARHSEGEGNEPPADDAFGPVLLFHDRPAREDDFIPYCWYTTMCPDSVFVRLMFLNLRQENGNISVRGDVYSTVDGAEHHSIQITEEEMLRLAKDCFVLTW